MYRNKLIMLLDELGESQLREIYHFSVFLKERFADEFNASGLPFVQAEHLSSLLGLTALGGDALKDTENIFNE